MPTVTSKDGTRIAYDKMGMGPAIILVDGALSYRKHQGSGPLAEQLADRFKVYTYDRRGRGESGDTQPYAVEREIEDLEALIQDAGSSVRLYGMSSGAALSLKAAGQLGAAKIVKLALYEPPFGGSDDSSKQEFAQYTHNMDALLQAHKYDEALGVFLGDFVSPEMLDEMRKSPEWALMESVAPTLAYENVVMGDGAVPMTIAERIAIPTLLLGGGESPAFMHDALEVLARTIPRAQKKILDGQGHGADPQILAPILAEFFA